MIPWEQGQEGDRTKSSQRKAGHQDETSTAVAMQRLRSTLDRIDRKGYGAYKDLSGTHDFGPFLLFVDRVQRDPFAPPSLIRIRTKENRFDPTLFEIRYAGSPSRTSSPGA